MQALFALPALILALALLISLAACEHTSPSSEKTITSFAIGNAEGLISEQTIAVTVPYGTDITAVAPVIVFTGKAVSPVSETPQDFTAPVSYQIHAEDGSTRNYVVIVRHETPDSKAITSFSIDTGVSVISEETITVTMPYGTDITALSPVIAFTGSAVEPASGAAQDFTSPVTYRVSAGNGSVRDYVVSVVFEGQAPITINFTPLPHEAVNLSASSEHDLSRARNDTLQITANSIAAGAPVRWFINSEEQTETGSVISIAAVHYPVGVHHVTALVYKNAIPYSGELVFKVVK